MERGLHDTGIAAQAINELQVDVNSFNVKDDQGERVVGGFSGGRWRPLMSSIGLNKVYSESWKASLPPPSGEYGEDEEQTLSAAERILLSNKDKISAEREHMQSEKIKKSREALTKVLEEDTVTSSSTMCAYGLTLMEQHQQRTRSFVERRKSMKEDEERRKMRDRELRAMSLAQVAHIDNKESVLTPRTTVENQGFECRNNHVTVSNSARISGEWGGVVGRGLSNHTGIALKGSGVRHNRRSSEKVRALRVNDGLQPDRERFNIPNFFSPRGEREERIGREYDELQRTGIVSPRTEYRSPRGPISHNHDITNFLRLGEDRTRCGEGENDDLELAGGQEHEQSISTQKDITLEGQTPRVWDDDAFRVALFKQHQHVDHDEKFRLCGVTEILEQILDASELSQEILQHASASDNIAQEPSSNREGSSRLLNLTDGRRALLF
jgi:hypothetical protein